MPHEPGSARHLNKRMKMAGLGRLNLYCQPCQKQCRDDNAFKQHNSSDAHHRRVDGIHLGRAINDFSRQFQADFLQLLHTSHRDRSVRANQFYQVYISERHHVHLNSTLWRSLSEFVRWTGRKGLCRVEEKDDGLHIAWIDRSPEAVRRADALRRRERLEAASEARDNDVINSQV